MGDYILYVIVVLSGGRGITVDSQPFATQSACESAWSTLKSGIDSQIDAASLAPQFDVQGYCVAAR